MGKNSFNRRKTLFTSKMDIGLKKRLIKCFVWSVVLYAAETWTLRKQNIKRLEAFEMWLWRRMLRIKWMDKISNKEILKNIGEKRSLINNIKCCLLDQRC